MLLKPLAFWSVLKNPPEFPDCSVQYDDLQTDENKNKKQNKYTVNTRLSVNGTIQIPDVRYWNVVMVSYLTVYKNSGHFISVIQIVIWKVKTFCPLFKFWYECLYKNMYVSFYLHLSKYMSRSYKT